MRKILPFSLIMALLLTTVTLFAASQKDDPFSWTNGYSLIVTSDITPDQANETVDFITDNGGQVAIIVSPRLLLGWANGSLTGQHGILAVHNRPVPPGLLRNMTTDEVDQVSFFNQVASGKWKAEKSATYGPMEWSKPDTVLRPDAKTNDLLPSDNIAPAYPGTSDFMVGKVRYNVFMVESDSSLGQNYYSWTCANITAMKSEVSAGLSFWSSKAATYGVPLSYAVGYYTPPVTTAGASCSGTLNVTQGYEPILGAGAGNWVNTGDALWVRPVMCKFGAAYCLGSSGASVDAFNSWSRSYYKTNWATSMFIVYNGDPAPHYFTDGYFAYAYVPNGPYSVILFHNNGWAPVTDNDRILAHETGHLFGADDEYASSGCNNCTTSDASSKNVVNGNCENCNGASVDCMMKGNSLALCGYTPGQLGWGLNITRAEALANWATTGGTAKTNWTPGQTFYPTLTVTAPGKAGECITLVSRLYIQYPSGVSESYGPYEQPCLFTTPLNKVNLWYQRVIPASPGTGEASFEAFFEFKYASGYYYGRGMRASARGKFFVLPSSANPISTAPVSQDTHPRVSR